MAACPNRARFDQMLADGFLDEVRSLMMRPDYDPDSPAMRAVGYRQAIDFIEGRTDMAAFHLPALQPPDSWPRDK